MSIDVTGSATTANLSELVAEEIRALMGRRRMSQAQLARALKVSPMWINYRLTGTQEIGLNDLQRIAEILDVEVTDLLPQRSGRLITTANSPADHGPRTNARSPQPPSRPTLTGQRKRADGRESNRRPGRITPLGAETITDRRTAEFFDTQAA